MGWTPGSVDGDPYEVAVEEVLGAPTSVFVHRPRSLRELLETSRRFADTDYYVFPDSRLTYSEHVDRVAAVAAGLAADHGISHGDRVAILAVNRVEWLLNFWAVLSLGGVAIGVNGWWATLEIEYALDHAEPALLLVDEKSRAKLAGTVPGGRAYPVLDIVAETARLASAHAGAPLPTVPIDEDDPAVMLYTSGTTGRPKAAVTSHRSVIAMVQLQTMARERRRIAEGSLPQDIGVTMFPFFHVSGLYGSVIAATIGGDTMVFLPGRFDAARVLDAIEQHRCTRLSVVPTTAWRIVNDPTVAGRDLSSVARIAGGGAPLAGALQQRLREVFPQAALGFGYGLTETAALATGASDDDLRDDPDTQGRTYPTVDLQIRGADGAVLPDGEEGDVYVRSPLVMLGYWRDPAATDATIGPGRWLRTGDLGRIVKGRLNLSARRSDLILRGGENVYPAEIELCLESHPRVAECTVFGTPDAEWGQAVTAVVVRAPGEAGRLPDAAELSRYVGERLAAFKVPSVWRFVDAPLPRTATGKVMKAKVIQQIDKPAPATAGGLA